MLKLIRIAFLLLFTIAVHGGELQPAVSLAQPSQQWVAQTLPMTSVAPASTYVAQETSRREKDPLRWWLASDVLVWQPHLRSQDFVAVEDGSQSAIGAGNARHAELDRDAGFRLNLGMHAGSGWGLVFGYTNFSSSGFTSVERPSPSHVLISTFSHPQGPDTADSATANTTLDLSVFDLSIRSQIIRSADTKVNLMGGVRWASIDSELLAAFQGQDFRFGGGEIFDRSEMDAFGLFGGGEVNWRLVDGWSIYGQATVGALYGRMHQTRTEVNRGGLDQVVDYQDQFSQPVFNIDARLGLSKAIGRVQFRTGYDMSIWTNVAERLRFSDDRQEAAYGTSSGDLLLEGLFFQGNVCW